MNRVFKRASDEVDKQRTACELEMQRVARKILVKHKDLKCVVVGMGSFCFWDKDDAQLDGDAPEIKEFRELWEEYHEIFTGSVNPWEVNLNEKGRWFKR